MRGPRRLLLRLVLPAALAGCANAPPPGEANAVTAAVVNAAADDETNAMADMGMDDANAIADDTVYPGSNAAAGNIVPGQVLQIYQGGLGVGAMGLHLAQFYEFGQPRALVMAMMANMRGQPRRTGRDENCRLGPIDYADFGNVRLNFQQDRFVGWHAAAGGPRLVDEDGFGFGSLRDDISVYDNDTIFYRYTARGTEFVSGGYHGLLSSPGRNGRVTDLWAGMICEPR